MLLALKDKRWRGRIIASVPSHPTTQRKVPARGLFLGRMMLHQLSQSAPRQVTFLCRGTPAFVVQMQTACIKTRRAGLASPATCYWSLNHFGILVPSFRRHRILILYFHARFLRHPKAWFSYLYALIGYPHSRPFRASCAFHTRRRRVIYSVVK